MLAGALAGRALAPSPVSQRLLRAGAVTLAVPAGSAPERLAVAFGPPADRTLVPRELHARVSGPPRAIRVGGQRAWSYRAARTQIVVLPTSHGMFGLACATDCARAVDAVTVQNGSFLTPTTDLAFALQFRPALAALDASRVRLRAALAGAPSRRSRMALALARAHATAAERLRPLAGPHQRDLLDRLTSSAGAYDRLATAAPASARAAQRSVADADARLAAAVARLRIAYAVQPATALPARAVRHWRTAALWLIVALAGALLAAKSTRPRVACTLERVASPPERVAPPPAWRWDTAPRSRGASPLSTFGEPPPP